jgi:hypothetical protein
MQREKNSAEVESEAREGRVYERCELVGLNNTQLYFDRYIKRTKIM